MCLILFAWRAHPQYPLVVAANRDEFFARPTAAAAWWDDAPQVFAGRDFEAGGTWLGVTRSGRFAALTNFRDPARNLPGKRSRGALVADFLRGSDTPAAWCAHAARDGGAYNGFNLLACDGNTLAYASNIDGAARELPPGVYGLSNHLLDTPWPKLVRARSALADALGALPAREPLFALLDDATIAPDDTLPRTGVSPEWERLLSAAFVRSPDYGTRSSTVLLARVDGEIEFEERGYGPGAAPLGRVAIHIAPSASAQSRNKKWR